MTAKKATTNKATTAKSDASAPQKAAQAEPAGEMFTATRGFEDGASGRKFAAGSETGIGAKKADISQTDAERFVEAGHGKIE